LEPDCSGEFALIEMELHKEENYVMVLLLTSLLQGGARNVIQLIVHVINFYYYKTFDTWYRINPHRLENCSQWRTCSMWPPF